ncbi:hypothetical protein [Ornithobacterium rhinotracheale]|uniref:hypothetical protein n=1 Tax=Ornithobacterium rhinotracheale TaxID=28251 RepID=UPI004036B656
MEDHLINLYLQVFLVTPLVVGVVCDILIGNILKEGTLYALKFAVKLLIPIYVSALMLCLFYSGFNVELLTIESYVNYFQYTLGAVLFIAVFIVLTKAQSY